MVQVCNPTLSNNNQHASLNMNLRSISALILIPYFCEHALGMSCSRGWCWSTAGCYFLADELYLSNSERSYIYFISIGFCLKDEIWTIFYNMSYWSLRKSYKATPHALVSLLVPWLTPLSPQSLNYPTILTNFSSVYILMASSI